MRRFLLILTALCIISLALSTAFAQTTSQLEVGDPPVASLISISAPDEDGLVTISGAAGAVFPAAQIAIRNLYTEQSVYTQAGITGTFTAVIYGPGNTPFWISPADSIPNDVQNRPGSLPGGPGVIIYGSSPASILPQGSVTALIVDGDVTDWAAYPAAQQDVDGSNVYALINNDSLYVAGDNLTLPAEALQLRVTFSIDGAVYDLSFNPAVIQSGSLRRLDPNPDDLNDIPIAVVQSETTLEMRIPWRLASPGNPTVETVSLNAIQAVTVDNAGADVLLADYQALLAAPILNEIDGIVRFETLGTDAITFTLSGALAQGASVWHAEGRINQLSFQPGDTLVLEMNVLMETANLPADIPAPLMIGEMGLQTVITATATGEEGFQTTGGLLSNNGWSSTLTPGGLPIASLRGDLLISEVTTASQQVIHLDGQFLFPMDFTITIPDDLPPGIYVPYFQGYTRVGNDAPFRWEDNGFYGSGAGISRVKLNRMPVALNVGDVDEGRMLWALFYDHPSDGSRGLLANEDLPLAGLVNNVRFNSPTYILPPGAYPIEPYLLNQMPNMLDTSAPPLLQFLLGRLDGRVISPSQGVASLGSLQIVQNRLSTAAPDERTLFGVQSPVDAFRLTTLNPEFTEHVFDEYGLYTIELSGSVEDIWGNRYLGGGSYALTIAEPADITPGVMPGTPFEVGDVFHPSLHIAPGMPADVTINLRVYPLDGSPVIEAIFEGQADANGYFFTVDEPFVFDTPGEYIADYEVRYTDDQVRLWAGSLRGAGVIANPEGEIISHGQRGLYDYLTDVRQAWFEASRYAPDAAPHLVNYPYNSGDVAWISDEPDSGLRPIMRAQDVVGTFTNWLLGALPDYVSPEGFPIQRMAVEGILPIRYSADYPAYSYISAVRPGVSARQLVIGDQSAALPYYWDANDPYNGQIGAGGAGDLPGDFTFLFGGIVVRGEEFQDASIYGALAMTINSTDSRGTRVYPPYSGAAGGPNGGALLTLRGEPITMFFHPTGVMPGQVLTVGELFSVAGQVAPTLASDVAVTITSPGGVVRAFNGTANAIGYFYDPAQDFTVDEAGVWTVDVTVTHSGLSSAGQVEPPLPTGGVLGAETAPDGLGGRYLVYVLPEDALLLQTNQLQDSAQQAGAPINFNVSVPDSWTDVRSYLTVTIPGYIVSSSSAEVATRTFSYQYNPSPISDEFPMLEVGGSLEGPAGSDVVTITLVLTSTDAEGEAQIGARVYTVLHDRLVSLSDEG